MVPWRFGEHVLQPLIISVHDRFLHALHVFSWGLHQAIEIVAGRVKDRAGFVLEVRFETAMKMLKALRDII
jgi:hypothetical protein